MITIFIIMIKPIMITIMAMMNKKTEEMKQLEIGYLAVKAY